MRCCRNKRQLRLHVSCQELAEPDDGDPGVHDLADQLRSTEHTLHVTCRLQDSKHAPEKRIRFNLMLARGSMGQGEPL